MKKAIIALILLLPPFGSMPSLLAQQKKEKRPDSYYLQGAVPEENGKVVFTKEVELPGASEASILTGTRAFMSKRNGEAGQGSTIVRDEQGLLGSMNHEYMVFSQSLGLDRGTIHYMLTAEIQDSKCRLRMDHITYNYPDRGRFTAEEWITDKEGLNKDRTKMYPGVAKWRRGTVDLFDNLTEEYRSFMRSEVLASKASVTDIQEERQMNPGSATAVAARPMEASGARPEAGVTADAGKQTEAVQSTEASGLDMDLFSSGKTTALSDSKKLVASSSYLSREEGVLYLTLVFSPSEDLSPLEVVTDLEVIHETEGKVMRLQVIKASLEKGGRGRPGMLIGTVSSWKREP